MKIIILSCLVFSTILLSQNQVSAQNNFITGSSIEPSTATVNNLKCSIEKNRVFLKWSINNNQMADQVEVETSADGKNFVMAALVFSTEKKDSDDYYFYEKAKKGKIFYRLKIINKDRSILYSDVVSP